MKILVVDDSMLDRKLLIRTLMKAEISQEILQAEDGEKALEILAEQYRDICLIILDWQMPKITGIEVLAGLVNVPVMVDIPVIMATASGSDENKKLAYATNPKLAGYIVKPYMPEDVLAAVRPHLK